MAANEAILKHGSPLTIDYTPGGAVLGGEVVTLDRIPFVSRFPIAANVKGSLDAGFGVYVMTADAAIAIGEVVYWDDSASKVTETVADNNPFGVAVTAASADEDKILVIHIPGMFDVDNSVYIPSAAQQTLAAGGGAVNVTSFYTAGASDAGGDAWTLADGVRVGQLKKIQLITDGGGDAVLTPTNLSGGTTITFADAGDYALLRWNGSDWVAIELGNDADGATAPVLA